MKRSRKMEKILSIIVPAYNVERYLNKCLSSMEIPGILGDMEVLVVNDGSTDRTSEVAEKFCKNYPKTYFLYTKENGGHGSAVNFGIEHATGKYFKVVDGDDWLSRRELGKFAALLKKQDSDVIASDFLCVQDGTGKVIERKHCTKEKRQYGKICSLSKGEVKTPVKMHSLTIKTEILKTMPYRLDEHCFYVDMEYVTYPIPWAESVYYSAMPLYRYRLGRTGQSVDIESMQKNRAQHQKVLKSLLSFYDTTGSVPKHTRHYIEKCIAQVVENQFQIYISLGWDKKIQKELRKWDIQMKKEYPAIYSGTEKKSITMLRKTDYRILKLAAVAYQLMKGRDVHVLKRKHR